jgi:hypothetical protein
LNHCNRFTRIGVTAEINQRQFLCDTLGHGPLTGARLKAVRCPHHMIKGRQSGLGDGISRLASHLDHAPTPPERHISGAGKRITKPVFSGNSGALTSSKDVFKGLRACAILTAGVLTIKGGYSQKVHTSPPPSI